MSYLTAGKVSLVPGADNSETMWPPECQFIGKDILRLVGFVLFYLEMRVKMSFCCTILLEIIK